MGLRFVVGGWSRFAASWEEAPPVGDKRRRPKAATVGQGLRVGAAFCCAGVGATGLAMRVGIVRVGSAFCCCARRECGIGIGCRDCLSFLLVRDCRIAGLLYKIAGLLYKISGLLYKISGLLCIKISGLLCIKISGLLCMRFAVGERGECEKMAW